MEVVRKAELQWKWMEHIVHSLLVDNDVLVDGTRETRHEDSGVWIHCTKGYGFIQVDNTGKEIYVHWLSIKWGRKPVHLQ